MFESGSLSNIEVVFIIISTIAGLIGTFLYDPNKKSKIPEAILEASKVIGVEKVERYVQYAYDNFTTKDKRHNYVVDQLKGFRDRSESAVIRAVSDNTIVTIVTLAETAYADQRKRIRGE
jgi:hypothetical protein